MITRKDRQMGPTTMKSTRDTVNPKRGGYAPVVEALKGVYPGMMTRKDQEIDRVTREVCKTSMNSRMGVCPNMTTHKGQEIE